MSKNLLSQRVSITVPSNIWQDVSFVSERMGITRSALVTEMLAASVTSMRALLESIPENPTSQDVKRLRGQSVDYVKAQVASTMRQIGGQDE